MNDKKVEQIATVLAAAFKKKPGGALLFATTQITQCLKTDDMTGASMWQDVGNGIAQLEMALEPATGPRPPGI
jgi:hypothetical protein